MSLTIEQIATNRYAPAGANAISLYGTGLADGLTLGQLVIAVSMRSAAEYEAQGIVKMNRLAGESDKLEKVAEFMEEISDGTADWTEVKTFCQNELGINEELPDAIDTYAKRMAAITALKAKANALTQQQQTDMIDLQTLVNRRDVAFSASSNIIRALGTSQNGNAINF